MSKIATSEKVEPHSDAVIAHHEKSKYSAANDPKLQGLNKRLLFINAWSLTGCLNYGFLAASIGSTLGQPNFYAYTGIDSTTLHGQNIVGLIVGLQSLGGAIGVILVCFIQDRWGRRAGFAFGIFFSLLGAALAAGFRNTTMLMFARLFSGAGGWSSILSAAAYQIETAPNTFRGALGGSIGPAITLGYTLAAWVSYGFYFETSADNFRYPFVLQLFFPLLTLIGLPFVPESPRWLLFNGHEAKAMGVLRSLHANTKDPQGLVAREEFIQIKAQVLIDRTLPSSWLSMFTTYKRRSFTIIFLLFAVQASGSQVVTNYGPTIYAQAGYPGSAALAISGGWYITAYLSDCFWALPIDRLGRRFLIVFGQAFTTCALAIMIALIAEYTPPSANASNAAGQKATIFAFYFYVFAYSTSEPTYYVYSSEIFHNAIRVKGIALALMSSTMTAFWATLSVPTGTLKCGWKFYLLFLCCTAVTTVLLYFFIPETAGLKLEDIAIKFGDAAHVATPEQYEAVAAELRQSNMSRSQQPAA